MLILPENSISNVRYNCTVDTWSVHQLRFRHWRHLRNCILDIEGKRLKCASTKQSISLKRYKDLMAHGIFYFLLFVFFFRYHLYPQKILIIVGLSFTNKKKFCRPVKSLTLCFMVEVKKTILYGESLNRYGSWAVCFTYGTWFGVNGLVAGGKTYQNSSSLRKASDFLLSKQLDSGGWGESYLSCQDKVNFSMNT